MSTMSVMPRGRYDWTVDDLAHLPADDGLQYELLDGVLLVTPSPVVDHQRLARGIFLVLHDACPDGFEVFFAPVDWQPDERTSLQPDVFVISGAEKGVKRVTEPLPLAVEILSPSTRRKDLVLKRSKYEDSGVASYWVVDPEGPAITAWDLIDGRYVEAGRAVGDETVDLARPFPVSVTPSRLR